MYCSRHRDKDTSLNKVCVAVYSKAVAEGTRTYDESQTQRYASHYPPTAYGKVNAEGRDTTIWLYKFFQQENEDNVCNAVHTKAITEGK